MPESSALPRVSVCLLTYKRAAAVGKSIESLLAQSHSDFELIINDDRSPDDTERVCREYAERDPRIRYVKNPTNLRYASNQNAALLRARHEYVAIVHDGDVYRRDLIEKWTRALVEQPTAAFVFNTLEVMNHAGHVCHVHRHPYGPRVPGRALFDDMIRRPDSPIWGIVMVRRSRVLAAGPFDPRLAVLGDVDMWLRLLLDNDAAYVAEPLLRIAQREAGHHNNCANWKVRREYELIYALNSARRYPDDPSAVARLRTQITPMLRGERLRALRACVRTGRFRGFLDGLAYLVERRDWASGASLDRPHTWAEAARLAGEPEPTQLRDDVGPDVR